MNSRAGETFSVWNDTRAMPKFLNLTKNIETDVCVVGGGIGGLTTAYLLLKEGKKICLLEDSELGSGQTGRTTAHFVTALDDRYFELEKYHGQKGAQLAGESHSSAIKKVREIVQEGKIDCELEIVNGFLFADGDQRQNILGKELEAIRRAGLKDVDFLDHSALQSFDTGPCLMFSNQVQLHPIKYLSALANKISNLGGKIFTNSRAVSIEGGMNAFVKTQDDFTIQCQSIVVATNSPINDLFAIHTKQAPYRTYVVGLKVPKGIVSRGLYWDTLDPYHYVRLESPPDLAPDEILVVGGEDHKTGQDEQPESRFERLIDWTRKRFPFAKEVLYRWSGQVMEPVDGLAYLGHNPSSPNNVYVITGDSGNGMTHCTIGAMLITDQIMGRKNPWEKLYSPSRITLRATPEFLKENANVAVQYGEWIKSHPKPELENLPRGEGTVFRHGIHMVAAYKDQNGTLEFLSASCPHLAGVVSWNKVEKSWDCPCHGSRFDGHGKVLEGPAFRDLRKLKVD